MRTIALLLASLLPLAASATPTTEAVDGYIKCLEAQYADAKASTELAATADTVAFDRCTDARERVQESTSADEGKRLVAEIDAAARSGMESAR